MIKEYFFENIPYSSIGSLDNKYEDIYPIIKYEDTALIKYSIRKYFE